jgi:hypothetical protein
MGYGLLADLIVAVHVAYVGFVVLGMAAIVVGMVFRWQWVRNPWFRCAHLLMISYVAFEALVGWACPLTTWEARLRGLAGEEAADGLFVGRLLHNLIHFEFPMWVFNVVYVGFALLVLSTFWFAPVRWRRNRPRTEH